MNWRYILCGGSIFGAATALIISEYSLGIAGLLTGVCLSAAYGAGTLEKSTVKTEGGSAE